MPGTSALAHWAVLAPMASIGHVLPTPLPAAHTTCTSIAPMTTQPATVAVTAAPPYAASLLPK